ncbi:hypothetical protein JW752_05260 [Candidatus Peregrinibacteria bacterium]|nr:hypothetical protein [Candidatus Peregrinibacteria bacterium]
MPDLPFNLNINTALEFISTPSFKTIQLAVIIYFGLLWLAIIIWVTRDAINRSNSLLFQVIAILLNIFFPVLGILLYLIIRPSKTTLERYYEELEHRLILESIGEGDEDMKIKSIKKLPKKKDKKTK